MTPGEYKELIRIADALEKIARALTTPQLTVLPPNFTYEPAPYWQNPEWKPPTVGN